MTLKSAFFRVLEGLKQSTITGLTFCIYVSIYLEKYFILHERNFKCLKIIIKNISIVLYVL